VKPIKSATKIETAISNSMANPPRFCAPKQRVAKRKRPAVLLPAEVAHQRHCERYAPANQKKRRGRSRAEKNLPSSAILCAAVLEVKPQRRADEGRDREPRARRITAMISLFADWAEIF
jgi:hypothetical protein